MCEQPPDEKVCFAYHKTSAPRVKDSFNLLVFRLQAHFLRTTPNRVFNNNQI